VLLGEVIPLVEKHLRGIVVQIDDDRTLDQACDARRVHRGLG